MPDSPNIPNTPDTSSAGGAASAGKKNPTPAPNPRATLFDRVHEILDLIRPAVQRDGGDLELVEVTNAGVVRIRLHGACVGCPSSTMTLRYGIEENLRGHIPEITGVEAVD